MDFKRRARPASAETPNATPLRPMSYGIQETLSQVWSRIRDAAARARAWWSGQPQAAARSLPDDDREVGVALERERAAVVAQGQECESQLELAERRRRAADQALSQAMEAQAAADAQAEMADHAAMEQWGRSVAEAERRAAAADALLVDSREVAQAVSDAFAAVEAVNAKGKARKPRSAQAVAKAEAHAPHRVQAVKDRRVDHASLVCNEATYPIPWKEQESLLLGIRLNQPPGTWPVPVPCRKPQAHILGSTGMLTCVDPTAAQYEERIADILTSSQIQTLRGRPIKHVFHLVLSKPLTPEGPVQEWESDEGMQVARHAMVAIGMDPDRHPTMVWRHQMRAKDGKIEECIHVLGSRVRDDGALHSCDTSFIALATGRARWDYYAGLDPARITCADGRSKPVRDGIKALKEHKLMAKYVKNGVTERIPLLGRAHAERLAREEEPPLHSIAGTWTPKPGYRSRAEILAITHHLCMGTM